MVNGFKKWEISYFVSMAEWIDNSNRFQREGIRTNLKILKDAGVDIVNINGFNLFDPFDFNVSEAVIETKKWIDELGFKVNSYHFWGPTFAPLDQDQDFVCENLLANIDVFKDLNPRCFVIHPGVILTNEADSDNYIELSNTQLDKYGLESILKKIAGNLRIMSKKAQKYGIKLALENTGYYLPFGQIEILPKLMEFVNEPNVGYCVDSGHAHGYGESVVDWLQLAGDKLFDVHFHDNCARGCDLPKKIAIDDGTIDEHLPLGFGTINWIDVVRTLHGTGFLEPITFECPAWPVKDPVQGYRLAIEWWKSCVEIASISK